MTSISDTLVPSWETDAVAIQLTQMHMSLLSPVFPALASGKYPVWFQWNTCVFNVYSASVPSLIFINRYNKIMIFKNLQAGTIALVAPSVADNL